jgi:predicted O-methyltransferase YrrM
MEHAMAGRWREVDDFFRSALIEEDAALMRARASSSETTAPGIEVAPSLGALLSLLVRMAGARRVLEFGTLAGYSAIWLARAAGPEGRIVTLELEPQNASVARSNFADAGVADRVEVLVGPALESAHRLIAAGTEPFDLVFIDADKPSNPAYLAAALELTRSGAVIVIDNVVRAGTVLDEDGDDPSTRGVREVARAVGAHPQLEATAIQTVGVKGWDGVLIARRR